MPLFNAGSIIKETRLAQGLTQEKLAEGICSRHTVVKIENGSRRPDWSTFRALARRLGLEPEMYSDIITEKEARVVKANSELARTADRDHAAFAATIAEMEKDNAFKKGFGLLIYKRALIAKYTNPLLHSPEDFPKSLELAVELAFDMLRTNRPDFDIDKIDSYYLSHDEMFELGQLANAYKRMEKNDKALELYQALAANYDRNYMGIIGSYRQRYIWSLNSAIILCQTERYEDSLKIIDEELKNALITNDMILIHRYMRFKVQALFGLGRTEEGEEWCKKFVCMSYGMVGATNVPSMTEIFEEYEKYTGKKFVLHIEAE